MKKRNATIDPVQAGDITNRDPEFVRVPQLYLLAGLRRGLCYRKMADGTFRSVLLREPGNRSGIRLIFWPSVKAYLHDLMRQQETAKTTSTTEGEAA